jgi:tetratricopeptide (TPR) repeat protein/outer membrane protein assembly factor BamB
MGFGLFWLGASAMSTAISQDGAMEQAAFDKQAVAMRTSLHRDPLLESSLKALVDLYQGAGRSEELIGLYRSHIEQYPTDAGAKAVLIEILEKLNRDAAEELIVSYIGQHADSAPLHYLYGRFLQDRHDTRAAGMLAKAIELEKNPSRQLQWVREILPLSDVEQARVVIAEVVKKWLATPGLTPDILLSLARRMQELGIWDLSEHTLGLVKPGGSDPELDIERQVLLAQAAAGQGRKVEAAEVLDTLLGKLASEHWRRREIMSLRIAVVATDEQRMKLITSLQAALEVNPQSESAILDLVETLMAGERRDEAATLLQEGLAKLPKSSLLESRALEIFDLIDNHFATRNLLIGRLEVDPDRSDLRFRLVRELYALGEDGAAEQEFSTVLAGLDEAETTEKILALQRDLQSLGRGDAARPYLERFVRNHPARLDTALELAEVYLQEDRRDAVIQLAGGLDLSQAEAEGVVDFVDFLLDHEFFGSALTLLTDRLKVEPNRFDLGVFLIRALAASGDEAEALRQINRLRDMTEEPSYYAIWLKAALEAHGRFESVEAFLSGEQSRYSFGEGAWDDRKVERFLLLCQEGRHRLSVAKVLTMVREGLTQSGLSAAQTLRLRRFLVGLLGTDPAASVELEQQLSLLIEGDAERRHDYILQKALLADRNLQSDTAGTLFGTVDFNSVSGTALLRESILPLLRYGFRTEALDALAAINRIDPKDLVSWDDRFALLVAEGDESALRAALRELRDRSKVVEVSPASLLKTRDHLLASYWRSIVRLLSSDQQESRDEILPLLTSIGREDYPVEIGAMVEWCRTLVLVTLGRTEEGSQSRARFSKIVKEHQLEWLAFPDGLQLSVSEAGSLLDRLKSEQSPPVEARGDFLLAAPAVRWIHDLVAGATILNQCQASGCVFVLDSLGQISALDLVSGKLMWRRAWPDMPGPKARERPGFLDTVSPGNSNREMVPSIGPDAPIPPTFAADERHVYFLTDRELVASRVEDGNTAWTAPLLGLISADSAKRGPQQRNLPRPSFQLDGNQVILAEPALGKTSAFAGDSGKLQWEAEFSNVDMSLSGGAASVYSMNSGVSVQGGQALVYDRGAVVLDVFAGKPLWRWGPATGGSTFPIGLKRTGGESVEVTPADSQAPPTRFADFTSRTFADGAWENLRVSPGTSLVGAAMEWNGSRLSQGGPALAVMDSDSLWLMGGDTLRQVSRLFPVVGQEFPSRGTWVGALGNHAWLVDEDSLHHFDYSRGRQVRLPHGGLRPDDGYRVGLFGNRIIVRGVNRYRIVHAVTGEVIIEHPWPVELAEYITSRQIVDGTARNYAYFWQGGISRRSPGHPSLGRSLHDLVGDDWYITSFGERTLVCLTQSKPVTSPPSTPGSAAQATSASPVGPAAPVVAPSR